MNYEFYRNKKVLVTGHTGFKGSWMCRLLQLLGADVCGYALASDVSASGEHFEPDKSLYDIVHVGDGMRSVIGDVRDYDSLDSLFSDFKPEIVIHMAAQAIVRTSYREPRYTYAVNVMGTVNVLECCRFSDSVRSVVNVTTDKVYRNEETDHAFTEDEYLDGYDPYSNSKSCSELVTSSYRKAFFDGRGIAVSTCRAGNVIGGGDFATDRIIPDSYRAVSAMEPKPIVVRNPYSIRPYQHVLEPIMAYLTVAMKQFEDYTYGGCYNIGPDDKSCITTGKLTDMFCDAWKRHMNQNAEWQKLGDEGPHEAGLLKLDNSLYKRTFGYGPVWDIYDAVDKTVEWYAAYLRSEDVIRLMDGQIIEYLNALKTVGETETVI